MAWPLFWSNLSTLRYSMMASRYCSRCTYRSPRSTCRAFCASGDRAHAAARSATTSSVIHRRVVSDKCIEGPLTDVSVEYLSGGDQEIIRHASEEQFRLGAGDPASLGDGRCQRQDSSRGI